MVAQTPNAASRLLGLQKACTLAVANLQRLNEHGLVNLESREWFENQATRNWDDPEDLGKILMVMNSAILSKVTAFVPDAVQTETGSVTADRIRMFEAMRAYQAATSAGKDYKAIGPWMRAADLVYLAKTVAKAQSLVKQAAKTGIRRIAPAIEAKIRFAIQEGNVSDRIVSAEWAVDLLEDLIAAKIQEDKLAQLAHEAAMFESIDEQAEQARMAQKKIEENPKWQAKQRIAIRKFEATKHSQEQARTYGAAKQAKLRRRAANRQKYEANQRANQAARASFSQSMKGTSKESGPKFGGGHSRKAKAKARNRN